MTRSLTVAVIGHVNHGKTALVRRLTGMETDRLKEEIERGLSITLGFAWRDYAGGAIDFIDSPGHEDFIRAMVAGATGARAALLVVSAVEGFARQTFEHLQIAGLLGIKSGLVAVTKADLVSPANAAAVRADLEAKLAGTSLAGAPIVNCSSITGDGFASLHRHLAALQERCPEPAALSGAFLPIDRVFTLAGVGTVVTGTLQGAGLTAGAEAELQPSGRRVGLRQLQVHGVAVNAVNPGGRVAVSLRGVSTQDVRAGDVVCTPGAFAASHQVDAVISLSPGRSRPLRHMDEVRVMWGARRDVATVRLWTPAPLEPGQTGLAQLRFAAPVIAFAGQRAILRRLSPAETLGGAAVLDPAAAPSRGKNAGRLAVLEAALHGDAKRIAACLADMQAGIVSLGEVARLARRPVADIRGLLVATYENLDADRLATREAAARARLAYLDGLTLAHRSAPARWAAPVGVIRSALAKSTTRDLVGHVERVLAAEGAIRLEGNWVALAGHDPFLALSGEALARLDRMETALRAGGLLPPDSAALLGSDAGDQDLLQLLLDSGRAIALRNVALRQTVVFHRDSLTAALDALRSTFPPGSLFATGEARAALGTSRKFIVPLLEHFDAVGLTIREGDVRSLAVPHPEGPAS